MNRTIISACAIVVISLGGIAAMDSAQAQGMGGFADPIELFEQADANRDGVVSRDEYLAARVAKFDSLDRNHDGYLTDADFPRLGKMGGERADKLREMLQKADTNHDGKVSREEFRNAGTPIFDLADANHDGVIDKAELQQAAERLKTLRQH